MRINIVKKARKQKICRKCHKDILVGESYKYITPYGQADYVICNNCNFKPWETIGNEYLREITRLKTLLKQEITTCQLGKEVEEVVYKYIEEFEGLRDEQQDKLDNLPEQFQEVGPGEIIQEHIGTLEEAIDLLENFEFYYEYYEDTSIEEMKDILEEYGIDVTSFSEEEIIDNYQDVYNDQLQSVIEDIIEEIETILG